MLDGKLSQASRSLPSPPRSCDRIEDDHMTAVVQRMKRARCLRKLAIKQSKDSVKGNTNMYNNNNSNKSIYIAPNQSRLLSGALQNMAN